MSPADRYRYFRIEAKELVEGLASGVLALERGVAPEAIKRLLRLAHTLKGAARVVEQAEIARAAHALEEALQPLAEQAGPAAREEIDRMLQLTDAISRLITALGEEPAPAAPEAAAPPPAEAIGETVRVPLAELEGMLAGIAEAQVQLEGLRRRLVEPGRAADDLTDRLDRATSELDGVREGLHRARLLPARRIVPELERACRDAAIMLGKEVRFESTGGETRLDGHVLLAVRDALLHLVRNAVDHGIESPAERRAAGKPAAGRIRLSIARRGDRVAFALEDDGRGLDLAAIGAAAAARGLIAPEEARHPQPETLTRLVFESGFSTRAEVTEISGRGVGLDVVHDVVARLKGELRLATEPGRGLTVEAIVPLSLLAIKALVVESGGMTAAIPLDAIVTTARAGEGDLARTGDREAFLVEEALVPFMPLTPREAGVSAPWSVVVVQAGTGRAAVGVDRIVEVEETVVRPLPAMLGRLPLVSGASLDAEGVPRPLYDPVGLVAAARRTPSAPRPAPPPPKPRILVVDDSLTTRMLEASILESAGYEVEVAASGEEGLAKARAGRYDLMIVDVEMPGMTGFEVVATTRQDPALQRLPAVLLTSRASASDRRRGAEVGARAYMVKGEFEQGRFLQTIQGLVGR